MESQRSNLVWIDLEMTGLEPTRDTILEIATVITDSQLRLIATGPELAINHPRAVLDAMDPWPKEIHTNSGLVNRVLTSRTTLAQAERKTLDFIRQHCEPGTALLAGNSVWQDRAFLKLHMHSIVEYLFYRIIDVTSFKEMINRWYPNDPRTMFAKKESHRAYEDIMESIEELRHYRKQFFV